MRYKFKGEPFDIGVFHVINDVQYPIGWFFDAGNREAMGIVEADDDEPMPPDPAPSVPAKVTRRQARQALLLAGRLDDVSVAIAALDDGTPEGQQRMRMAQIEWEDSLEFERARPLVIEIAASIGLDAAALDQMFITAAGL
jgi:hypothetical protein